MPAPTPSRVAALAAPLALALTIAAPTAALAVDATPATVDTADASAAEAVASAAAAQVAPTDAATTDKPSAAAALPDAALPDAALAPTAPDATTTGSIAIGGGEEPTPSAVPDDATPAGAAGRNVKDGAAASDPQAVATVASSAPQAAPATQVDSAPADPAPAETAPAPETTYSNMYRLYNPWSGEHFYTGSLDEARSVAGAGWQWEAVGWVAPDQGEPVFRLYNPYAGDHHYTLSAEERDKLVALGWRYEGVGWYSDASDSSLAVLRQYNPYAVTGTHNFTVSASEDANLRALGWRGEGEAWRASKHDKLAIDGFWLITSAWGTLERYWVGADAAIARGRIVEASEGAGYYAYASDSGAVVRGAIDRGDGWAWLAGNDGRLAAGDGWLVTDAYGFGLQRYYLGSKGAWALARLGDFTVDGCRYYGRSDYAFELRNDAIWLGSWLWANNDGVLGAASELLSTALDAAHWTPATPAGWCAAWVENVIANAGLGDFYGDACDLYDWYCFSGNLADIRPGMIVAVSSHPHTEMGSIYGHVGIYVGNGSIRDSVYGYVREMRLSEWMAYYGASVQPRWGWLGGVAAC